MFNGKYVFNFVNLNMIIIYVKKKLKDFIKGYYLK